jgi:1-acyl-sn-glycerol-3-phosphate acyltransferase
MGKRESVVEVRMKALFRFLLLLAVKVASRLFYRFDVEWVGAPPPRPWRDIRIIAVLNHTSLYEPIFAGIVPVRVLWKMANHGVVPIADKTMERPAIGWIFRNVGGCVVSVSRKRDETWRKVLECFDDPRAITVIFPEGRMLRRTGLDTDGQPMTVKAGIADLLAGVPSGRMLLAYSGGLHHVAAPGDRFPRLFRRVAMRLEEVDIDEYRDSLEGSTAPETFRRRVVEDMTTRRNRNCPVMGPTTPQWAA